MDEYTKLKLNQLDIAQESSIVVYSRERTGAVLGRKIRAEFGRVYISNEVKDCQKALSKIKNDSLDSNFEVDCVVIEYDTSALKLIDYINRRPLSPETSNCALIPTVIVVPEDVNIDEARENIRIAGGANKVLDPPYDTKQVLMAVIDLLYNRKKVEDTFQSLKKVQFIASKYPYVPIFGGKSPKKMLDSQKDTASVHSGSTSVSAADFKLDEIDDVTECSSLYPTYLKAVPKDQLPSIRNTVKKKKELSGEERLAQLEADELQHRLDAERLKLQQQQSQNLQRLPSHDPNELGEDSIEEKPSGFLDITFPSADFTQSENARVDSRVLMEDEYSSIFSDFKDTKSKKQAASANLQKCKSLKFLDPSCRPYWSGSMNSDSIGKARGADIKYDIRPFVEKDPPSMARPSSVGGLDKRSVMRYWHLLGNGTGKLDSSGKHNSDKHASSPPTSPNHKAALGSTQTTATHHDLPPIPESRSSAPTSPRQHLHHAASMADFSHVGPRRPSTSGMSLASDGSKDYLAYLRATKQISQIARSSAPDYQLNKILEVDLSHRKINQGEKDMLLRAINLERDGDVESAIILYTRAGAHSKDQQISKMLLGNIHYRQQKFMAALNFYNLSIKILLAKNESVRIVQDEFLSHYNRAVINFRLGNDDMGMQDIEMAVKLEPSHIQAREVLSIARRRMGKFTQAIEEAVSLKHQRSEKIRLDKLQAQQALQDDNSSRDTSPSRSIGQTMSRNSSPSRDGISPTNVPAATRIFNPQFGGFQLKVSAPSAKNGVREKIAEGKMLMRGEGNSIGQSTEGGNLKMFKLNNGLEMEIFDDLFKKPSLLQHSLLMEPSLRTVPQYQIIKDTLKLFPFLRGVPDSLMQELGRVIEYRTMTGKEEIFGQNEESATICMLLSGHVQVRQDYPNTGLMGVTLGELEAFASFGHIDILFRRPRTTLLKALEECLLPHYMKLQKLATNSIVDAPVATDNAKDDMSVDTIDEEDNEGYQRFNSDFKRMWDVELHGDNLDRAISPGMFMTYTMTSPCEFFFVSEREFNRVLLDSALEELKTRLRAIVSSGIFQQWSMEDVIRLSRMAQIKTFKRGELILEQGKRPDFFYIILKGLCKVTKKPNRTEMLYQKLHAALEKADQHDLKYVFHHTVSRVVLEHKTAEEKQQVAKDIPPAGSSKSKDKALKRTGKKGKHASSTNSIHKMADPVAMLRKFSTDIPYQVSPPTEAERARQELQAEIDKLQGLIQKAHEQDAFDNREDRTMHSFGSKADKSYCLATSDHPHKVLELAGYLSGKVSEITTLQWPRIFGESCIIDPDNGISRGSILADTQCDVLALHRSQIQTFPVDKEFIDRVKAKSVAYPMDPDLVVNLYKGIEWRHYKDGIMTGIRKARWPKRLDDLEPFLTGPSL